MFLNYFALGVLIFVFLVIFYGIIILHDIPYLIAKKRNHPHADAIHVAGWVGLVCGASAIYLAMGEVLNEQFGRTVLPIGEPR